MISRDDLPGRNARKKLATLLILLNSRCLWGCASVWRPALPAKIGGSMRLFAVFVAICALSQTASAQSPECKSISDPGPRLACYDKAAPPASSASAKAAARVANSKIDSSKYVDTISAEDALMNARLKNICKGC
jgi:hypothetical protein